MRRLTNLLHVGFFVLFFSVCGLNYFFFRLPALDFGIANQALYGYAHGIDLPSTLILGEDLKPYLGLHFSIWVPIFSPFYYVFGDYTLLIIQCIALIFCGEGIYRVAREHIENGIVTLLILLQFYTFWGIYSALSSGFHDNAIGACFVPWLLVWTKKGKLRWFALCVLAILVSKENLALWMPFLLTGIWFMYRQKAVFPRFFMPSLLVFTVLYFLVITHWFMPSLNTTGTFEQLGRYSYLGSNLSEILHSIVTRPFFVLELLWKSHVQPDPTEVIKQEFLLVLFLSGGWAMIRQPIYLWMALPLIFQKCLNKEIVFWGLNYHYNIELAPLAALALIPVWKQVQHSRVIWLALVSCLITIGSTITCMQSRVSVHYDPILENIFDHRHYSSDVDRHQLNHAFSLVEPSDAVSANSRLVPHLAFRKRILLFPNTTGAEKLILLRQTNDTYPLSGEAYEKELRDLLESSRSRQAYHGVVWQLTDSSSQVFVFSRVQAQASFK